MKVFLPSSHCLPLSAPAIGLSQQPSCSKCAKTFAHTQHKFKHSCLICTADEKSNDLLTDLY